MHLQAGLMLGARYALQSRLAGGGMGEVWCAEDTLLGRHVAVKVPHRELADEPGFSDRLLVEARLAAAVVHPGIAAVFDVHDGDPLPYLVLELVQGRPLSKLVSQDGPLHPDRVRNLVCQVAAALAAAHAAGLVHRDVKPANLLVRADDVVKMTDFGIARAADAATTTRSGFVTGTAQYLSPEQAGGRPATAASDLYALGVVAYECLAGHRPFEGEPLAVLMAHREQPVPPLPAHVPDDLRRLVLSLLDKDPHRRPTAAELAEGRPAPDRTQLLELPPPAPVEAGSVRVAGPRGRRRRLALAGAAAVVAVGAVSGMSTLTLSGLSGADGSGGRSASAGQDAGRPASPPEPAPAPLPVADVSLFHPGGSGQDRPGDVGQAVDGDPGTAWATQRYNSAQFGNLRPGVGLLLDLGQPREVREARVQVDTPGLSLRLHAGDAADPAILDNPPLGTAPSAAASVAMTPSEPVTARYVVVWIDRLPDAVGGRHSAAISDISLLG
jgi:eukaryotic-like serine/threonine-protein kinase